MDFTLTEEQQALSEVAEQIFAGSSSADRVTEVEATEERFDRELWAELAQANLLGVAISEDHGGLGFGITELGMVLEQQGRSVAPVPLLATLVLAAFPIDAFGSDEQRAALLPGVVAGTSVLTGALQEWGTNDPLLPSVVATNNGDGYTLAGSKPAVPAANVADHVVVSATVDGRPAMFVVAMDAEGLVVTTADTTNHEIHGTLDFDNVVGDLLGSVDNGLESLRWTIERASVAMAAIAVGCCDQATRMAAEYTSEREQFGRPLSHNQAVTQRAADCYIGTDALRLVLMQAAWRLDNGIPAAEAVRVAKWWAAEGGQQVVHNVQHLHGGMGADVDYPVHRYFLWVKQLENTLGGGSQQLATLGRLIADKALARAQ